eukprot:4447859-Prymnesium_polylepis.3
MPTGRGSDCRVPTPDPGLSFERPRALRVVEGVKCAEHLGPDEVFTHLPRGELLGDPVFHA